MTRTLTAVGSQIRTRVLVAIALFTSLPCVPAFAADCGPLKRLVSMDLIPTPSGLQMVPVTINGMPKKLLLGTAGGISTLSKTAVANLGLHTSTTDRGARLLNRTGEASDTFVVVKQFDIGGLQGKDVNFMVAPNPQMGSNPNLPIDGVMAGNLFEAYDVEMDFSGSKLNYFSTDHCDGKVIYWPAKVIAIVPYKSTKPGTNIPDTHIRVPVVLDGKELDANIDTGSLRSTMSAATARYVFHVTAESPDTVPLGTVANDPEHKVFGHTFSSLSFEGVTISNPRIVVIPDLIGSKDPYNDKQTGSNVKRVDDALRPEISIGMDVLKNLHLYLASREHKLYITAATLAAGSSSLQQPPPTPRHSISLLSHFI